MLSKEIDKNGHNDRNFDNKIKRQKPIEQDLGVSLLDLILKKTSWIFLELSIKHLDILNNEIKKL